MRALGSPTRAAFSFVAVFMLCLFADTSASAQETARRSRIELHLGLGVRVGAGTTTSGSGVETTTDVTGPLGGIGFARWLGEDLAGTVSVGVLSVGTETSAGSGGAETQTSLVLPLFVGVRKYLVVPTSESGTGLFASVEIGPVMGVQSGTSVGAAIVTEELTRKALGARLGLGVDLPIGSRVVVALMGGYVAMTDFSDAIGGEENHGGPHFTAGIGLLVGGGA